MSFRSTENESIIQLSTPWCGVSNSSSPAAASRGKQNTKYFRYKDIEREQQAWHLLERENLTTNEILQFCHGTNEFSGCRLQETNPQQLAYRRRRQELYSLLTDTGRGAFIDRHGRLLPTEDNNEQRGPPLPPLPDLNPPNHHGNQVPRNIPQHQDAIDAIERALDRYRQEGVPDEDLQLIRLEIPHEPLVNPLTMRRIFIAVGAVVMAYVSMLIQTLAQPTTPVFSAEDPLPAVILQQRSVAEHLLACGSLTNRSRSVGSVGWFRKVPMVDCSDGVLMIPSESGKQMNVTASESSHNATHEFQSAINVIWWIACENNTQDENVCQDETACFRGVHDAIVDDRDVGNAIRLGKYLISHHGTDHLDIQTDASLLQAQIPHVVAKLKRLLQTQYHTPSFIKPIAFRVYAAGSITGDGVRGSHLSALLNHSNYRRWTEHAARKNRLARQLSLPWPFTIFKPIRDSCYLMADRDVDESFDIHTSVLLSDSSSDGMNLFVDEVNDKVTRGLAIESSVGRVIVSSTGNENRRCRLPTRSGVRAALQIWWTLGDR